MFYSSQVVEDSRTVILLWLSCSSSGKCSGCVSVLFLHCDPEETSSRTLKSCLFSRLFRGWIFHWAEGLSWAFMGFRWDCRPRMTVFWDVPTELCWFLTLVLGIFRMWVPVLLRLLQGCVGDWTILWCLSRPIPMVPPGTWSQCSPSSLACGFLGTSFHRTPCRSVLFPAIGCCSSDTCLLMPSLLSTSILTPL